MKRRTSCRARAIWTQPCWHWAPVVSAEVQRSRHRTFTKGGNGATPHLFRPAVTPVLMGRQHKPRIGMLCGAYGFTRYRVSYRGAVFVESLRFKGARKWAAILCKQKGALA